MRLRQAHAALEAAQHLAATGFEFHPIDHDRDDLACDVDYLTGFRQITDPDHPDDHARTYSLDITPGPGEHTITARLVYGYPGTPGYEQLLKRQFQVWDPSSRDRSDEDFQQGVGGDLARLVIAAVDQHEVPYVAAYEKRSSR